MPAALAALITEITAGITAATGIIAALEKLKEAADSDPAVEAALQALMAKVDVLHLTTHQVTGVPVEAGPVAGDTALKF